MSFKSHHRVLTLLFPSKTASLWHTEQSADVTFSHLFVFPAESDLRRLARYSVKVKPLHSAVFFFKKNTHLAYNILVFLHSLCVFVTVGYCKNLTQHGGSLQAAESMRIGTRNGLVIQVTRGIYYLECLSMDASHPQTTCDESLPCHTT